MNAACQVRQSRLEEVAVESASGADAARPGPTVLGTAVRLLTFRASREELLAVDRRHLALGLSCSWLVGMGRYWDSPDASLLQHLGLGSVLYVFALSALLWLLYAPLRPRDWRPLPLLTFVTLVSPPAALYAIPVERFVELATARELNVGFLATVAVWRVALLIFYLSRVARLRWHANLVASLLPLALIIVALTALNLERAVFDLMGGLRDGGGTANDSAYGVLWGLTLLSMISAPALLLGYLGYVLLAWKRPAWVVRE